MWRWEYLSRSIFQQAPHPALPRTEAPKRSHASMPHVFSQKMHIGYQNVVQQCSNWGPQAIVLPPQLFLFIHYESQQTNFRPMSEHEYQQQAKLTVLVCTTYSRMRGMALWFYWCLTSKLFGDAFVISSVCQSVYALWKSVSVPIEERLSRSRDSLQKEYLSRLSQESNHGSIQYVFINVQA